MMMYARLGWIDQPMKMRETSRVQDKKLAVNNNLQIDSGGLGYIDTYKSNDRHVLCCFVNPGDIISFQAEGQAFRTDALMPNNVWDEDVPLKGIYHSSDYAKLSEERLAELIKDAVNRDVNLMEEQDYINAQREMGVELKEDE